MQSSNEEGNLMAGRSMVEEIMRIRELAARLEGAPLEELPGNSVARAILEELNGSISRFLSFLDGQGLEPVVGSPSLGDSRGEISSRKRKNITQVAGDRRGGCRRRSQPSSCRIVVSKTLEDGKTWRKYGQKEIHSSKHPRSYFRCTHKFDQGCKALRQVQLSEEDPTKLMITYMGEHTCVDPSMFPQIISNSSFKDSCLISFGQEPPLFFASSLKKELDDEVLSNFTCGSSSSDCNYMVPAAGETPPSVAPISTVAPATSDHGETSSEFFQSPASSNLDLDFMTYSLGFYEDQHMFPFEHDDLFRY